jgi:hypothetical protein
MKKKLLLVALAFTLAFGLHARAQDDDQPDGKNPPPPGSPPPGCESSPENPTLILAGLAGGVYAVSSMRTRLSARRADKK